jgi:hypothetical protein
MGPIVFAAAMIGAAFVLPTSGAMAQNNSWCSVDREGAGENCAFVSYEQCIANGSGVDRWCLGNSQPVAVPADEPKPAPVRAIRKKPDDSQQGSPTRTSTLSPGAKARIPAAPGSRMVIPLPGWALLAPPTQFDCEFSTASLADGRSPPGPAADAALRMKLDYERQCYRQAEMIVRDRLRQLLATVGETIKAIERGGLSAVPRPDRALLAPPAEFNCEFKSNDDGRGPPQPSQGAQSNPDAALRMKLDYEQQCYRHAEMISRERLRRLQAALGETIKAVDRIRQPGVEPPRRGDRRPARMGEQRRPTT